LPTISGLRDMDGVPVEFLKIVPGGFVVMDVDGNQSLISRHRWDGLPAWGASKTDMAASRPRPTKAALAIAMIGLVLMLCDACAWVIHNAFVAARAVRHQARKGLRALQSSPGLPAPATPAVLDKTMIVRSDG
jgi:hypothetical protein